MMSNVTVAAPGLQQTKSKQKQQQKAKAKKKTDA